MVKVQYTISSFSIVPALFFIIMRAFGLIDWSWFWILCPLWIPLIIMICVSGVYATFGWAEKPPKDDEGRVEEMMDY